MEFLSIESEVSIDACPEDVFDALLRPSAIRHWWNADRAIVHAVAGGLWMAAWGDQEDSPDYLCAYTLKELVHPLKVVFCNPVYHAEQGDLPDSLGEVEIEFAIQEREGHSSLRVTQSGLPASEAEFCEGCQKGWETTLRQLSEFLERDPAAS